MRRRKDKPREPGIRVVNGKRIDLKIRRARQAALLKAVAEHRAEPANVAEDLKKRVAAARKVDRLRREDGGKDGTKLTTVRTRLAGNMTGRKTIRSRPGSFEWRYGRNAQSALYHAGSQFARLCERAGMTIASSADFLRGTSSGHMTDMAEGRIAAIDKLKALAGLGHASTERLISYCVEGKTADEIAQGCDANKRDMAAVLHQDLRALAKELQFAA